jgi:hypothetical protein
MKIAPATSAATSVSRVDQVVALPSTPISGVEP